MEQFFQELARRPSVPIDPLVGLSGDLLEIAVLELLQLLFLDLQLPMFLLQSIESFDRSLLIFQVNSPSALRTLSNQDS